MVSSSYYPSEWAVVVGVDVASIHSTACSMQNESYHIVAVLQSLSLSLRVSVSLNFWIRWRLSLFAFNFFSIICVPVQYIFFIYLFFSFAPSLGVVAFLAVLIAFAFARNLIQLSSQCHRLLLLSFRVTAMRFALKLCFFFYFDVCACVCVTPLQISDSVPSAVFCCYFVSFGWWR